MKNQPRTRSIVAGGPEGLQVGVELYPSGEVSVAIRYSGAGSWDAPLKIESDRGRLAEDERGAARLGGELAAFVHRAVDAQTVPEAEAVELQEAAETLKGLAGSGVLSDQPCRVCRLVGPMPKSGCCDEVCERLAELVELAKSSGPAGGLVGELQRFSELPAEPPEGIMRVGCEWCSEPAAFTVGDGGWGFCSRRCCLLWAAALKDGGVVVDAELADELAAIRAGGPGVEGLPADEPTERERGLVRDLAEPEPEPEWVTVAGAARKMVELDRDAERNRDERWALYRAACRQWLADRGLGNNDYQRAVADGNVALVIAREKAKREPEPEPEGLRIGGALLDARFQSQGGRR